MNSTVTSRPIILIHNFFNFGHFLVYADNITRWALGKGFSVAMMGFNLAGTDYARVYARDERVWLLDDSSELARRHDRDAETNFALLDRAREDIPVAQRRLAPLATFLLTADEFIFNDVDFPDLETPTTGILTFGHRDHYLADFQTEDSYSTRLTNLLERRDPLLNFMTLDEYHAASVDPAGEFLHFLPDMFALSPASALDAGEGDPALKAFLDQDGPVIPVLGKFDQRKNSIWTLRAVAATPGLRVVVLGERLPCLEDEEVDSILRGLEAEGRAFVRWGFVPESLFTAVLAHPSTPFVPLPYDRHTGSSGLQLQALAQGKPTLVPDDGLMARRVAGHGLGMYFNANDESHFRKTFAAMLRNGPEPYTENIAAFMECFTSDSLHGQLDRAAGLSGSGTGLPHCWPPARAKVAPYLDAMHAAIYHFVSGRVLEAEPGCDLVLAVQPGNFNALMMKAHALDMRNHDLRRMDECLTRSIGQRGLEYLVWIDSKRWEQIFQLVIQGNFDQARRLLSSVLSMNPVDIVFRAQAAGSDRPPVSERPVDAVGPPLEGETPYAYRERCWEAYIPRLLYLEALNPTQLQALGGVLAHFGKHDLAARCFRDAYRLFPQCHDYLLNLSDVLRYAGRLDESARALDEIELAAPDHPGLHHKRGQVLFTGGDDRAALAEFLLEPPNSRHYPDARRYIEQVRARLRAE